ncbi:MAG: histidine--tRNA ligase [Planctomycetota bacterium]
MPRPKPRNVRGFRDRFAADLLLKQRMVETVRRVYESYGFVPMDTPALEFVDGLGKFLPESATPEGGIFYFRNPDAEESVPPSHPDHWVALRYDLTAPLARVVAQYQDLPRPFRRYQIGTVWRLERPGPGRFREFTQFDFDSVGVKSVAADAETCSIVCDTLEALGFAADDYLVKVNNRKVMQGVLEVAGVGDADLGNIDSQGAAVLRAIDKLDRLGLPGVVALLGEGRKDRSGHFAEGAGLEPSQIERVERYLGGTAGTRDAVCAELMELVGDSETGREGVEELLSMHEQLGAGGYGDDRVSFDPTIVRGLSYYTGPVFEGVLTREITDEDGKVREFGSIFGGGRYDDLVERFTGQKVPATGASAGVDRMLEAVKLLEANPRRSTSRVLVTVMDKKRVPDYLRIAGEIRASGIAVEVFLGSGNIGKQLKYADKVGIELAVIAGSDEFKAGEVQVKDLALGRELAAGIESNEEWRAARPAQQAVPTEKLVETLQGLLRAIDR